MEFYCFANVSKFGGNFLWAERRRGWDSINKVMYLIMKQARGQWIQLLGNLLWPGQTNHKKKVKAHKGGRRKHFMTQSRL